MAQCSECCYDLRHCMAHGERLRHWRDLAEGYLESAAVLYRKQKYPQMLHHCYFAVQSALEAKLIARRACQVPSTISLVVMAAAIGDVWSVAHRELFLELTEWYRGNAETAALMGGARLSKDQSLRTLMATAQLVEELRDAAE